MKNSGREVPFLLFFPLSAPDASMSNPLSLQISSVKA